MKKYIYCFLFLLLAVETEAQVLSDSLHLNYAYYRLNNGIRVVLQPDTAQKEVSVEFWVGTGAKDEQPGKYGFAHFFEHATPYGLSRDSNERKAFLAALKNSNAQTRRDYTRYYVQVIPSALPLALRYSADRLRADTAKISARLVDWHRNNVLNEMKRQESNPFYGPTAAAAREEATFGKDNYYGHGAYGSVQENQGFTADEVKKWYEQYFFTDNIILFVVGNFDPLKTRGVIETEFGSLNKKGKRTFDRPVQKSMRNDVTVSSSVPQHFLSLTWPVMSYHTEDAAALQILALIVDERLAKNRPASLKESGSSDLLSLYEFGGEFGLYGSFSSLSDSTAIEAFLSLTINDLIKNGLTDEELHTAVQKQIDRTTIYLRQLGFVESRTELLGEGLLFADDPGFYYSRLQKQLKLKPKDLQRTAAKWLKSKPARVLLVSGQ